MCKCNDQRGCNSNATARVVVQPLRQQGFKKEAF